MKYRWAALALGLVMAMAACAGCASDEKPTEPNDPDQPPQQQTQPDDDTPSTPEPPQETEVNDLVKNFWQSTTMYDESVLFVAETDENGNVIAAPRAQLLFEAERILSVKQYFHQNNAGKVLTFAEGEDFTYEDGALIAKGSIAENAITQKAEFVGTVPYVTDKALTGEEAFPGLGMSTTIPSTDEGRYLPFTEGYQIVQMQLSVTYTHALSWQGTLPSYFGADKLAGSVQKLKNKQTLELFVYGDSIATGANSSSVLGIEPYLATWPKLLAENLSAWYGGEVNLTNRSVGGWTSANGVGGGSGWVNGEEVRQPGLKELLAGDLKGYSPDLVLLAFGMNDATLGLGINAYLTNMQSMIDAVRAVNPACEIILVGTMLANPKAREQSKNQSEYTSYLSRLAERDDKICVVDIGAMHGEILAAGKHYTEISANNVNHPNDFMARVYAMNLLSALIDYAGEQR